MQTQVTSVTISPALRRMILSMEARCSFDCCGVMALEITPDRIKTWMLLEHTDRSQELFEELCDLKAEAGRMDGKLALIAKGLESAWEKDDFVIFLQMMIEAMYEALYL